MIETIGYDKNNKDRENNDYSKLKWIRRWDKREEE